MNQSDLNYRMQKKGATQEEMEKFAAKQTLDMTDDEKAFIDDTMAEIEKTMADNFSFLITYGKDGKDYKSPEIIDKIEALLK